MTTPLAVQGATLRITVEVARPVLQLRLDGELDMACADLLDAVNRVEGVEAVAVDLGGLAFCDCAGMRALLGFRSAHVADGRPVHLVNAQPALRRLFQLFGQELSLAA